MPAPADGWPAGAMRTVPPTPEVIREKWASSLILAMHSFRLHDAYESPLPPTDFSSTRVEMQGKDDRVDTAPDNEVPSSRTFLDIEGAQWRVYEQAFSDYDRRSGMSLIFASEGAVRRVRDFPPDWIQLSNDELLALSWKS
ncbi:MAG: hypothetical protein ABIT20_12645 [Gemmatimonadaceae bacterium]